MKKTLLFIFVMMAIVACNKKNDPQDEQPEGIQFTLTFDSDANTITAVPSDTTVEYALFVWMKEDYILDYGDDFSDAHVKESMQSYINMCNAWGMAFPTFRGVTSMGVYEWFDQPYPGYEFIAMAAQIDVTTGKIVGNVSKIFFVTAK